MWVRDLADATPACGGKAMGLARLIAAGLPVPPGFAIEDAAFRAMAGAVASVETDAIGHALGESLERILEGELPEPFAGEVERRARMLIGIDGPITRAMIRTDSGSMTAPHRDALAFAIRSSATIEDGAAGAAAGVFSSQTGVPLDRVWSAIRAVWISALTPLAAAYARTRGTEIAIGVVIQRFVPGERVTIYTRAPGAPRGEMAVIQRGDRLERVARSSNDPLLALALRAEAAIGAPDGADVELVEDVAGAKWVVQARPIVHPVAAKRMAVPPALLAGLVADGRVWTWDIGHNPDPLSPAQVGLIERVDHAGVVPYEMRVVAGYLYSTPRADVQPIAAPATTAELRERFAALEARLGKLLDVDLESWRRDPHALLPVVTLGGVLDRYVQACGIYGAEMTPLVSAARGPTTRARPSAVESTLLAAGRGEINEATAMERLGFLAPAWDVAVPTYAERPFAIPTAIARARNLATPRRDVQDPADLAAVAADLAERDDEWFARAQLLVRRALLARADELGIDRSDVFWIPLDDLLSDNPLDPDDVRRRASAARNAATRAAAWEMPIVVGGDPPADRPELRGVGTGPRVTGRVVRFATLASTVTVGHGDVIVTRAVTPALAVQVIGCAAIVSESGGLLDHGAAMARELGITCVVGCRGAWTMLADGMVVSVDGDRGTIEIET